MQCVMCSMQCLVSTIKCVLCSKQSVECCVQCVVCSVQCVVCSVLCSRRLLWILPTPPFLLPCYTTWESRETKKFPLSQVQSQVQSFRVQCHIPCREQVFIVYCQLFTATVDQGETGTTFEYLSVSVLQCFCASVFVYLSVSVLVLFQSQSQFSSAHIH